jgi:hypothetical protein
MNSKNNKFSKVINLHIVEVLTRVFGYYVEFKLYEKSLKYTTTYKEAENLSGLISFIMQNEVKPSDLISSEDEKVDQLLESYLKLKSGYIELKQLGLTKKQSNKIFTKLSKTMLKIPTYYLSIPMNCKLLSAYINGVIDKKYLEERFVTISILGKHEITKPRTFYRIYSNVLENYKLIKTKNT